MTVNTEPGHYGIFLLLAALLAALPCTLTSCKKEPEIPPEVASKLRTCESRRDSLQDENQELIDALRTLKEDKSSLQSRVSALERKVKRQEKLLSAARQEESEELTANLLQSALKLKTAQQALEKSTVELEAARKELRAARSKMSSCARLLHKVGAAARRSGDHALALPVLKAAVELGAQDPPALYRLARSLARAGDYQSAAGWYVRAAALMEKSPQQYGGLYVKTCSNLGVALVRLDNPRKALEWYGKAVRQDASYAPVHFNLGLLYERELDNAPKAIEAYRRHVALAGSRSNAAVEAIMKLQAAQNEDKAPKE